MPHARGRPPVSQQPQPLLSAGEHAGPPLSVSPARGPCGWSGPPFTGLPLTGWLAAWQLPGSFPGTPQKWPLPWKDMRSSAGSPAGMCTFSCGQGARWYLPPFQPPEVWVGPGDLGGGSFSFQGRGRGQGEQAGSAGSRCYSVPLQCPPRPALTQPVLCLPLGHPEATSARPLWAGGGQPLPHGAHCMPTPKCCVLDTGVCQWAHGARVTNLWPETRA